MPDFGSTLLSIRILLPLITNFTNTFYHRQNLFEKLSGRVRSCPDIARRISLFHFDPPCHSGPLCHYRPPLSFRPKGEISYFLCKSHARESYLLCKPIDDQEMAAEKDTIRLSSANPDWKVLSDEWFEISPFARDDKKGNGRDDKMMRSRTVQQVQGNPLQGTQGGCLISQSR